MSKRTKPAAKYRGLSFPVPLLEEVKTHIGSKQEYRSVSEFIRDSIREKIQRDIHLINEMQRQRNMPNDVFLFSSPGTSDRTNKYSLDERSGDRITTSEDKLKKIITILEEK